MPDSCQTKTKTFDIYTQIKRKMPDSCQTKTKTFETGQNKNRTEKILKIKTK